MVKIRRRSDYAFMPKKKQINLDNLDTSGTVNEKTVSATQGFEYDDIVKVPPPFKGDKGNQAITWSELSYTWKVVCIIGSLFMVIGVPSIWFVSKIESKVENIENNVSDIKQTTQELTKTTIINASKIESIERFLDEDRKNTAISNKILQRKQ